MLCVILSIIFAVFYIFDVLSYYELKNITKSV